MTFLYNISISTYHLLIRVASLLNEKAKLWIDGRKNIFQNLESVFNQQPVTSNQKLIWFHCASLGEFEQGRPLIERCKIQDERCRILVTFFSPSGYEIRKNYKGADYVFYLPMDSKKNAKRFLEIVKPSTAIFIKYEFWFHYLDELKKRNIPAYLVSASFREEQHFFKWYGGWFRKMLGMFTHIFVQNENSKNLLEKIDVKNVLVSGDTRFDRVYETAKAAEEIPLIEKFKQGKKIFIAGSTWAEDEKVIAGCRIQDASLKLIIAPHEINENHIHSILQLFSYSKTVRFSQATEQNISEADVLIIDNIGMLSRLYRYGDIAYVGGAFGTSLHNILEPAAFGLPVLFGPNHHKFPEAAELIEKGGAFSIANAGELKNKIDFLLRDEMILMIASEVSRNFVRSNTGATEKIMERIGKI